MDLALALLAGCFVGAILGLVAAGGAMLSVPILLYIFHFTPVQATTAALAIVYLAAFAGVIPKWRKGDVLPREGFAVWGLGLVTNLGGSVLAKDIAPTLITTGFAGVMVLAAIAMLRTPASDHPEKRIPFPILAGISLAIGAMTGLFGVGGGFLAIPILVRFFHTPQNKAAGTSLLIIALNCFTSFLGHHSEWSDIRWSIPICIGVTAVLVSSFASHHAARVPQSALRKSLAGLLIALTIFTLLKTWLFT